MRLPRLPRSSAARGALIGICCALLCWWLNSSPVIRSAENWALDGCFLFRDQRPTKAPVVIVSIDDESLRKLDKPLVFISPELAKVITYLEEQGAAAIAVDLLPTFSGSAEGLDEGEPGDASTVGRAVYEAGNVVLAEQELPGAAVIEPADPWLTKQYISPEWTDLAYANLTPDFDAFVRRQLLMAGVDTPRGSEVHAGLAFAVFAVANKLGPQWYQEAVERLERGQAPKINGEPIEVEPDGRMLINYVGPPGTIDRVPFHSVLASADGTLPLKRDWKGSIVLIGTTGPAEQDRHATPFCNQSVIQLLRSVWLERDSRLMPGVEIHANVIATLHDKAYIITPWWASTPVLLLAAGALMGAALAKVNLEWGLVITFLHHWVWKAVCMLAFVYGHWRIEMVAMMVLGALLYGAIFAMRWRRMRRMFGMVKSEAVARALEADPSKLDLRGEEREITVLFSDIRDFTTYSENTVPHKVVEMLNAYFSAVVPIIEKHGGTLNQYMGDGLMVMFGAPETQPDHAARAVRAAIEMVECVHRQAAKWEGLGAEDFRIGVGIHTGPVVIGSIGSPKRLDYTAIGDTVNSAARIEAANKELKTEILISQVTLAAIPPKERGRLAMAKGGQAVQVKGKQRPLTVHAIDVGDAKAGREATRREPELVPAGKGSK